MCRCVSFSVALPETASRSSCKICSLRNSKTLVDWSKKSCQRQPDILFLKHACSALRQSSYPVCGSMEEPSQFSVGQTAQSLSCSVMEKPHTGWDDCLVILLSCFRKRMSGFQCQSTSSDALHLLICPGPPIPRARDRGAA